MQHRARSAHLHGSVFATGDHQEVRVVGTTMMLHFSCLRRRLATKAAQRGSTCTGHEPLGCFE
jgi:hypothetical protein